MSAPKPRHDLLVKLLLIGDSGEFSACCCAPRLPTPSCLQLSRSHARTLTLLLLVPALQASARVACSCAMPTILSRSPSSPQSALISRSKRSSSTENASSCRSGTPRGRSVSAPSRRPTTAGRWAYCSCMTSATATRSSATARRRTCPRTRRGTARSPRDPPRASTSRGP